MITFTIHGKPNKAFGKTEMTRTAAEKELKQACKYTCGSEQARMFDCLEQLESGATVIELYR